MKTSAHYAAKFQKSGNWRIWKNFYFEKDLIFFVEEGGFLEFHFFRFQFLIFTSKFRLNVNRSLALKSDASLQVHESDSCELHYGVFSLWIKKHEIYKPLQWQLLNFWIIINFHILWKTNIVFCVQQSTYWKPWRSWL